MRLQLLVNHYREPGSVVARFMRSVTMQESVPWDEVEVLVGSDGTTLGECESLLVLFGVPARHVALPHTGVCGTRNALLGEATADYVMFCDVDDAFHSTLGLCKLLKAIDDLGTDVIASPYDVEERDGDTSRYRVERHDTLHVHGKAFRRAYLEENGIRFPGEMEFSGDMYFLWLAFNLGGSVAWMTESFYAWRHSEGSITRANPWHRVESYGQMLRCYELLHDDLVRRGRDDLRERLVAATFAMAFCHFHDPSYAGGPERSVDEMVRLMRLFVARHADEYRALPYEAKRDALHGRRRSLGDVGWMDEWTEKMCGR